MASVSGLPASPLTSGLPASSGHRASSGPAEPDVLLLVEDDAGDAVLVRELLADSGLTATLTWARTITEARQMLASQGLPGCVLLDLHLPDAHGLEAVTALLTAAPGAPVVVLTGMAEEDAGLAAVAAGAQDYLIKGQIAGDVFSRAIRYAVQRKQVERAAAELQLSALRAAENARLERGLLPTPLVRGDGIEVVARYRPGRAQALLGGDFYDVVETPDGSVQAVIGDVAGHGATAAAMGVCLRVAWRSLVLAGIAATALAGLLEQILVAERDVENMFATLTHLAVSPDHGTARFLRAGHPGLLLRAAGRVELVEGAGGPALGLMPGSGWREEELRLPAGASLVLFTDGLFEGRTGPDNERLGEAGLLALARELAGRPAAGFVDGLIERIEAAAAPYGGLADDIALVHLGWRAGA